MKAFVTGGCGFIGSYLVDVLLKEGYQVKVLDDLSRGRYIWGDGGPELAKASLLDEAAVRSEIKNFSPDIVFHLAAHHYIPFCEQNPYEAFTVNVSGTLNVIDAARHTPSVRKFFFASTGDVYAPSGYAHSETDVPSPVYVYGETKLMGEIALKRYRNSVRVPFDIAIGRLFNAAGPRETNPHFLPEVVRQIESGNEKIEVGNTWPLRDFIDVRSMASVIREITERTSGIDVFNIGSGQAQSVQSALSVLLGASGKTVKIESTEARKRPNDRPYLCPVVTKLQTALGHAAKPFSDETARSIWNEPYETRILYRA